jgi:hypothetical protein
VPSLYTRCSGVEKVWFVITATVRRLALREEGLRTATYSPRRQFTFKHALGTEAPGWNYPESEFRYIATDGESASSS